MPRHRDMLCCLALAAAGACGDVAGPATDPLEILDGDGQSAVAGSTLSVPLEVRATDGHGRGLAGIVVRFTFESGQGVVEPAEATTDARGRAAARVTLGTAAGEYRVRAAIDSVPPVTFRATAVPGPAVTLAPIRDTVIVFRADTVTVTAVAQDAFGNVITERRPRWSVSQTGLASVSAQGVITGLEPGQATLHGELDGARATVPLLVTQWVVVASGYGHTCGLTLEGRAYCWGGQGYGELGSSTGSGTSVPVPVSGGLRFSAISTGDRHTCALTTEGTAYCWGDNALGQLGVGLAGAFSTPQPVDGRLHFQDIAAGSGHTCGLSTDGQAYCWGSNERGQLGTGDRSSSSAPVAVAGGATFVEVDGQGEHTCGLSADGSAHCWGLIYEEGSLDVNVVAWFTVQSPPGPVPGGAPFSAISVERFHGCGLSGAGQALCWGDNTYGQLGNGSRTGSRTPVAVSGGWTFSSLSAGAFHTCGLTTAGAAHCWGFGTWGQLGTRATLAACTSQQIRCALTPVPVAGGHTFAMIAAGYTHTCAITLRGVAYCWGFNRYAQTGSSSGEVHEPLPVRVPSPR